MREILLLDQMKKRDIVFTAASAGNRSAVKSVGHDRLISRAGAIFFNKAAERL
jgi:hypothetical protein